MKTAFTGIAAALTLVVASTTGLSQEQDELKRKADAIRASASEMNFTKIPWVTDLFEGFRVAKDEQRPVFLYMITGDPLDDC